MKVAFITKNISENDGWANYSWEVIKRLPKYGIEPIVLTPKGTKADNIKNVIFHPVIHSSTSKKIDFPQLIQDYKTSVKLVEDCKIVHSLVEPYVVLSSLLSGFKKPSLMTAHGTFSTSLISSRKSYLYRLAYRRLSKLLPVSNYTASRIKQYMPHLNQVTSVVNNGVSFQQQNTLSSSKDRESSFLMVGQVKPRKGTLQAVEAMVKVITQFPGAKLYIAGDTSRTDYIQRVKATAKIHGIEANIVWLGKISDQELHHYYSCIRGLVMPSMNINGAFEGFGLVHLEANSFGVPAIGSLNCGNEDAIKDGYSGFLIEQGNIDTLATAMINLLNDDSGWETMSQNSLEFAQYMSWERTVQEYVSIYRELVS